MVPACRRGCIEFETMRTLDDFEWNVSNVEGGAKGFWLVW